MDHIVQFRQEDFFEAKQHVEVQGSIRRQRAAMALCWVIVRKGKGIIECDRCGFWGFILQATTV